MTDTTADVRHRAARTGVISPLVVVMVLVSAYSLWQFVQDQRVTGVIDGWDVVLGAAAIWIAYGVIGIGAVVLLQRYARRPGWTVALALAWGGLTAVYFAAVANDAFTTIFQNATGSDDSVWTAGPLGEETIKAVGVIALALVPVLRRFGPLDGLFYGVVVGAGFQVVEDFVYSLSVASEAPVDARWESIWTNVLLRGVLVLFSHAVWTGVVGAGIGWVATGGRRGRGLRVLGAVGAFVLAVLLHVTSNWGATHNVTAVTFGLPLLSIGVLVALILPLQRREERRLTELAVANDGWGVVDTAALSDRARGRHGRKNRRLELRYAYARDQDGPDGPATRRAASRLHP